MDAEGGSASAHPSAVQRIYPRGAGRRRLTLAFAPIFAAAVWAIARIAIAAKGVDAADAID
jgi:hypothetical protein